MTSFTHRTVLMAPAAKLPGQRIKLSKAYVRTLGCAPHLLRQGFYTGWQCDVMAKP